MPSLERDAVESSLVRKGFVESGGDHRFFKLMHEGRYTGICTKTSRGSSYKVLNVGLVSQIAKQLKLTTKEFVELVECPLTAEAYIDLLLQRDAL